jgi:hydrogenase maturation protein HypF
MGCSPGLIGSKTTLLKTDHHEQTELNLSPLQRYRFIINGIVQGVGFRPFLYRLAQSCGVSGYALNSNAGVILEVEGEKQKTDEFESRLNTEAPPLAKIISIDRTETEPQGSTEFIILPSGSEGKSGTVIIPPDIATCDKCFAEMNDPSDRRFGYPFINCTDCGPRYTIIKSLPYDRSSTTMSVFHLCPECKTEYENPLDRRFHAEPNACPICGPSLSLIRTDTGEEIESGGDNKKIIKTVISFLEQGRVLAIKSLGGFHIACDADNSDAVHRLRKGKNRPARPLAVMSSSLEKIGEYARIEPNEADMLSNRLRPIVLLEKNNKAPLVPEIAPDNGYYGVMLPYTPLHNLLMQGKFRALVMTSANNSGEPIIKDNRDALARLKNSADFILCHNRDILVRCDDSITRWDGEDFNFIRISRGWAPYCIRIHSPEPDRLACGAELKNTFCLVKGDYAYMSGHIGDLGQKDIYESYRENIEHLINAIGVTPRAVIHDLHPDYLSTRFALEYFPQDKIAVQHHHAHILSAMAENNINSETVGIALDGTGYGADGTIWGGEILIADRSSFKRYAHFQQIPLPGGDAAAKEPWKMTLSFITSSFPENYETIIEEIIKRRPSSMLNSADKRALILQMIEKKINTPLSSSAGRLFAAVSALLGFREISSYEGEAESVLEWHSAAADTADLYSVPGSCESISSPDIFRQVVNDYLDGRPIKQIGRKFHNTLIETLATAAGKACETYKIKKVVLTGGVFQNMLLLKGLRDKLCYIGLEPVTHRTVPANDAGISIGQAYYIRKK